MKRFYVLFLIFVCGIVMSACDKQTSLPNTMVSNDIPSAETTYSKDKIWSEQEITSMFYDLNNNGDLEYIDCVLIPDKASDRIGAVLFLEQK